MGKAIKSHLLQGRHCNNDVGILAGKISVVAMQTGVIVPDFLRPIDIVFFAKGKPNKKPQINGVAC